MTEIEPEIETVTVTFEEFKENLDHYVKVKETKRVAVMYGDHQIAAFGPWLPDEKRPFPPRWFWDETFPPLPMSESDPYELTHALEAVRGYRPFA